MKKSIILLLLISLILFLTVVFTCQQPSSSSGGGGSGGGGTTPPIITYTVTYVGKDKTGGDAPTDSNKYKQGATVTVLGAETLVNTGFSFIGWNTQEDGGGTNYAQGQTFKMGNSNVTLYAKWTANPTYTVTYNGNYNSGGSAPIDPNNYEQDALVTVLGAGTLVHDGYLFRGWNTKANGSGINYIEGQSFTMGTSSVTLYAKWYPTINYQTVIVPTITNFDMGEYIIGALPVHTVPSISSFRMGKYEVTYEQWCTIRTWAGKETGGDYLFSSPGNEGNSTNMNMPTERKLEPVTNITWRDCIIWCNAASEYEGLTPVYNTDVGFTTPLRKVTGSNIIDTTPGSQDNPFVNWSANGYRLPTEAEWEAASRYLNGTDWTPGNFASGAWSVCNNETATGQVAWYNANSDGVTHDVGIKIANQLGIFDMSGNVSEWCWDWGANYVNPSPYYTDPDPKGPPSGTYRILRGGSVEKVALDLQISLRFADYPFNRSIYNGLRLVRKN